MAWSIPIYDRTLADVTLAKENQENPLNLKGALNVSDLNRIEENAVYLYNKLKDNGYNPVVSTHSVWQTSDLFYLTDMDRIRQNVLNMVENYSSLSSTPTVVIGNSYLGIVDINDVEHVLHDLNLLLENMIASFVYCGDAICGG